MKTTKALLALGVGLSVLLTACSATGTQDSPASGITVKRDGYGIPHVYADTTRALYSGYGYSVAEDRLFQMEMAKRSSIGTAAEVLGPDYVEIDKTARNSIDPQSIKDQLARLPQNEHDIFELRRGVQQADRRGRSRSGTPDAEAVPGRRFPARALDRVRRGHGLGADHGQQVLPVEQ